MNTTTTITDLIPYGKEHAISREKLASMSHTTDRYVRRAIQLARDDGELILNLNNGYYKVDKTSIDEIKAQYYKDKARALSVLKRLKTSRKILKEAGERV